MTQDVSSQNRANDRFYAKNGDQLRAEVVILRDDVVKEYSCQLADLSQGGCAVRAKLGEDSNVTIAVLRIHAPSLGIDLELAGRLCWNQQTSVGSNTFGFRFRRGIEPTLIDQMVDAGLITRREEERMQVGMPVQLRRAHGKDEVTDAVLEDCSASGMRMTMIGQIEPSERLLVTTPSGVSGTVSVVWLRHSEDGRCECGCVFQNLRSARSINDELNQILV
ncbi:PilZ domain-containing protein [Rhodopirellula sp. JC740]|uniref:PilZ domain-containing protein n=1 Tax=Rhodopirellula halodulae TaxID=2894198 RepID=A0ABS8NH22_9BACT|nr:MULTISPECIES: PilZ domain-containing protein [unclassified Rhodopirellula]MCC9642133.1 PilZ domain-containing protein [Rhodopirellula sp. JC740]MCC9655404.1 PilZ domain-containing protein [Rhodopirellula sp. JC737]